MKHDSSTDYRRVVVLVCTAHFFSHFYHILVTPLFPLMRAEFNVGFTELGLAITLYSLTTALTQAPVGFAVDRYGARIALTLGLMAESVAMFLIGAIPGYLSFLSLMVLAGLGNAVFHPADYAILNARVPPQRIGRSFSLHTFSGVLGSAIAPGLVLALASFLGWRSALMICGGAGAAVAVILAFNSSALAEPMPGHSTTGNANTRGSAAKLLFSTPILMATAFFVGIAMFGSGITAFGISALQLLHPDNVARVAVAISAYLFAAPVGVLAGGHVADRITRHDLFAAVNLVVVALCAFAIAAFTPALPGICVLLAIAGFASGVVSPSRDMIVRALAPAGQAGKVFGFVTTGFNIGGIIAPPVFGYLLDHGRPEHVFWVVGAMAMATVLTVLITGERSRARSELLESGAD